MRVLDGDASGMPRTLRGHPENKNSFLFWKPVTDSPAPNALRERDGAWHVFDSHDYAHSARTEARTRDTRERTVPTGMFICSAASS